MKRSRNRASTWVLVFFATAFVVSAGAAVPVATVTVNPGDIFVTDLLAFGGASGVIRVDPATGVETPVSAGGFLVQPFGIAIEASGNLVVADASAFGGLCPGGCGGVVRVNPATGAQSIVSTGGFFVDPFGIAIEADGKILVSDASGLLIRVHPSTGAQQIVSAAGFFASPTALAVEASGTILVDDQLSGIIRVDPVTGTQTPLSPGGLFCGSLGLALEAGGDILVTASPGCLAARVVRVNPLTAAQSVVSAGGLFSLPFGLAVEAGGDILVVDPLAFGGPGGVIRVNPVTGAQTPVPSGGLFVEPVGIAIARTPQVITVAIDITPGSLPNSINPRNKGVIPVAILTTNGFDAVTVDPVAVRFGPTGNEAVPVHSALEDVDGDGDIDLILHFRTQDTGIQCGAPSASLTGQTVSGQVIQGADSIRTVGCK